uniref:Uncharacterized protein n=1 Tax=Aplanochytrium stocchinoi TaxID=215587 RepID=A0A6S8B0P0_9STRA
MAPAPDNCSDSQGILSLSSDANANFGLGITVFSFSLYGAFLVLYFFRRRSSEYLQRRDFRLIFLTTLFSGFLYIQPLREYIGRENFSCLLVDLGPQMTAFMVIFHLARVNRFMLSFAFNVQLAKLHYKREAAKSALVLTLPSSNTTDEANHHKDPESVDEKPNSATSAPQANNGTINGFRRFLTIDSFIYSTGNQLRLLVFLSLIIFLSISLSVHWGVANCTGCEQSFQTHIFVAIFSLLLTITTVYLMRYTHIRNDPDILGMYSEL